jgi:hypothetical protein
MLRVPLSHFRVRPGPLEWLGIAAIVLLPRGHDVINVLPAGRPRPAFQIAPVERMIEQLRLVEPRCTGWRQTGVPPNVISEGKGHAQRSRLGRAVAPEPDLRQRGQARQALHD